MSTLLAICLVAAGFALAVPARPDRLLARRVRLGGRRSWVEGVRELAAQGATRAKELWVGRRGAERRRAAVREACDVVVAELRAGHSPGHALEAAGAVLPELTQVATTGRMGGDVPAALRAVQRSGGGVARSVGRRLVGGGYEWRRTGRSSRPHRRRTSGGGGPSQRGRRPARGSEGERAGPGRSAAPRTRPRDRSRRGSGRIPSRLSVWLAVSGRCCRSHRRRTGLGRAAGSRG